MHHAVHSSALIRCVSIVIVMLRSVSISDTLNPNYQWLENSWLNVPVNRMQRCERHSSQYGDRNANKKRCFRPKEFMYKVSIEAMAAIRGQMTHSGTSILECMLFYSMEKFEQTNHVLKTLFKQNRAGAALRCEIVPLAVESILKPWIARIAAILHHFLAPPCLAFRSLRLSSRPLIKIPYSSRSLGNNEKSQVKPKTIHLQDEKESFVFEMASFTVWHCCWTGSRQNFACALIRKAIFKCLPMPSATRADQPWKFALCKIEFLSSQAKSNCVCRKR